YENEKDAKAIGDAVSPDNFKTPPGLFIETESQENRVITLIRCTEKVQTFIATVDDLLFCATTAEKTIRTMKNLM
ncbi:MAG: hypothetical protein GWO20_11765, partial [Candidatus Korarchaeota archaeon]|nr:hypothetical protein [Candidatus Korarchaeota archaeon]